MSESQNLVLTMLDDGIEEPEQSGIWQSLSSRPTISAVNYSTYIKDPQLY